MHMSASASIILRPSSSTMSPTASARSNICGCPSIDSLQTRMIPPFPPVTTRPSTTQMEKMGFLDPFTACTDSRCFPFHLYTLPSDIPVSV